MLTFISENPWITGWLALLFFLLVIIIAALITAQVEKYIKVKYNYFKQVKYIDNLGESHEIKNLDISIADPDSDFSN